MHVHMHVCLLNTPYRILTLPPVAEGTAGVNTTQLQIYFNDAN